MFEKATRRKLRVATANGVLSTEDLWDLSLEKLDDLAKDLQKHVEESRTSFIDKTKGDETSELAFNVILHIIDVKLNERKEAEELVRLREQKRKVLDALTEKEVEELANKSSKELRKELNKLAKKGV
jgi:hypothetical protein